MSTTRDMTTVETCKQCGTSYRTSLAFPHVCPPEQPATETWCDDCHGYTHMPWCPSYRAVSEISDEEYRSEASGWFVSSESEREDGEATIKQGMEWIGQVKRKYAHGIVHDHHLARLVPELESALRSLLKDYEQAYHDLTDGQFEFDGTAIKQARRAVDRAKRESEREQ